MSSTAAARLSPEPIAPPPATHEATPSGISPALTRLIATTTGAAVASIYYSQPILGILMTDLRSSARTTGWIPTLTQFGYALGILLLSPLGDRFNRRHIILCKSTLLVVALVLSAAADNIYTLMFAGLWVGLGATLTQDLIPAAASLAPDQHRGRIVGTVMTGLLLGILLSRVASGWLAGHFSWQSIYLMAAGLIFMLQIALWRKLPQFQPTTTLRYRQLLASMFALWGTFAELRRAAWAQGLLSAAFSAFWTTLAFMLHDRFQLGSAVAGTFGLAGAVGALAAPIAGRLADRLGTEQIARIGAGLAFAFFASLALGIYLPAHSEWLLLGIAIIGFDLGIHASLVAHQTLIYRLAPNSRSRLNALLVSSMFLGMAAGSSIATWAYTQWGWWSVVGLCSIFAGGALVVRCIAPKQNFIEGQLPQAHPRQADEIRLRSAHIQRSSAHLAKSQPASAVM